MKPSVSTIVMYGVPVLIVIGLIGLVIAAPRDSDSTGTRASKELVMSCTTDMATTFHIHPTLTIMIDGVKQSIPANVGITNGCLHPVHTHDASGKIHVESPEAKDFTIGDFFLVWGKTFTANQILDSVVDDTHTIKMTVNGENNTDYENYVVHDLDDIVISYESK